VTDNYLDTLPTSVTSSLLSHTAVPHKLHWKCITGWISNTETGWSQVGTVHRTFEESPTSVLKVQADEIPFKRLLEIYIYIYIFLYVSTWVNLFTRKLSIEKKSVRGFGNISVLT